VLDAACPDGYMEVACLPGDDGCTDERTIAVCDAGGTAMVAVATCAEGEFCVGGACKACAPHSHKGCKDGDVWWVDSCGLAEEFVEDCGAKTCLCGACKTSAACKLSDCSEDGFSYTCATASKTVNYSHGGPGPNGISSVSVHYDNGRVVTCACLSSSSGSCHDDTTATCTF